jgi:hypothetical protein
MGKSFNALRKEEARKNDEAISGTRIARNRDQEGNDKKDTGEAVAPQASAPKDKKWGVAENNSNMGMQKSMRSGGGIRWSQNDLFNGLAVAMDPKKGEAGLKPNMNAQPLVKREAQPQAQSIGQAPAPQRPRNPYVNEAAWANIGEPSAAGGIQSEYDPDAPGRN